MKILSPKIQEIINNIKLGVPIIIVDDYDRENEGDLMLSASKADEANLLFLMNEARGLMCIPCDGDILDKLSIPMMVENNTDKFATPFTVSVDSAYGGSGMSVSDRLLTIKQFLSNELNPNNLTRPGHLFPLRPRKNLLLERQGHTETSIELCKLSKEPPVAIIIEIMNQKGQMMRGQELIDFGRRHRLNTISVKEVYEAVYN